MRYASGPRVVTILIVLSFCIAALAAPAWCQSAGGKWEVEFHAGGALGNISSAGTTSMPPQGQAFTTFAGRTSRQVSSWYVGDGATLVNQIVPSGVGIYPLDTILTTKALTSSRTFTFAFRVTRRLTPRLSLEGTFAHSTGSSSLSQDALDNLEATRASYPRALTTLFTASTFPTRNIASVATATPGANQRTVLAVAVRYEPIKKGKILPYVVGGGGLALRSGELPSGSLAGVYTLATNSYYGSSYALTESDSVSFTFAEPRRYVVGTFGGGVKLPVAPHWGLVGDVREQFWSNKTTVTLSATNDHEVQYPYAVVATNTAPSIQISASSSYTTTLSGPALDKVKVFSAKGINTQLSATVGLYVKF